MQVLHRDPYFFLVITARCMYQLIAIIASKTALSGFVSVVSNSYKLFFQKLLLFQKRK